VNGRFNQPDDPGYMDPLNPQSMNRYAYVQNNPLRWVDPTGHTPQEPQSPDKPVFRIEVWGPIVVGPPIGPPAQLSPEVIAWLEFQWQTYSRWRAQQMERLIEEARANGELPMTYGVMPLGPPGAGWLGGVGRAANAAKGANSAANIANKIIHIFRPGKNLEGLVRASGGSPEAAYTAVQQAANQALRGGVLKAGPNGVLPGGGAGAILNVNGVSVQLIGGFIKDGVVYIGSFVGR
jgi:hypothetical protein